MMHAVVLVGGFGTRLRPLTYTRPKQMLPIVNRPLIEHLVARLVEAGVDQVVLAMGYKPDAFREAYPDNRCAGAALHYAVEPEPLDTAGAIRFAAVHAGINERFLVLNGDVLTDLDLGKFASFHEEVGAEATIHLHPVDDPSRFGVVPTDDHGRVLEFVEKPAPGEAPTNLINAGTYMLEPSVLDRIADGRPVSVEQEIFPSIAAHGRLYATAGSSYWIDVGVPAQYLQAHLDILRRVPGAGSGDGRDAIAAGATIEPGATVELTSLGPGASVAAGARVQRSVLLPGAQIGPDAVVEDSVLGEGAVVEAGASITGESVVGDGEIVSAGAQLVATRLPAPS